MPVPSETPWPASSPLFLTAISLSLGNLSWRSHGWPVTALATGALVMALLAAVAFLQSWLAADVRGHDRDGDRPPAFGR